MDQPELTQMKSRLDKVSPGLCLAKWLHVTLHLHIGSNHSCHHPDTHQFNLKELESNPGALHNTAFKKKVRQEMLDGHRPSECFYCWDVEDSTNSFSDRVYKSSSYWASPYFTEVMEKGAEGNIMPKYLEVSFSHACNFKCSYCAPHFSTTWENEIKKDGPYMLSRPFNGLGVFAPKGKKPLDINLPNPYVDAFWKWWPEVYPHLKVMRVTGGEPLLSPNTFKVLDKIKENPNNSDLEFAVNTNLGVSDKLLDKLIKQMKQLRLGQDIKKLQIYTSVDTWGVQAEYIRSGLQFEKFWANLKKVLIELPEVQISIMCTFNNLSVPGFKKFLEEFLKLRKETKSLRKNHARFNLSINHLNNPPHQSISILPPEYLVNKLQECLNFVDENRSLDNDWSDPLFSSNERAGVERLLTLAEGRSPEKVTQYRSDFYRFFTEHDRRRGTNFLKTFPELESFWQICKKEDEKFYAKVKTRVKPAVYKRLRSISKAIPFKF